MANGFVQIACIREIPGWKAAGDHWAQLPCSSWATWSRLCSTAFSRVGFKHLQGWRPHILSAQPFSVSDHPRSAKSVSLCSDGSSCFSLRPLPATWHATEKNLPQLHSFPPAVFYALRFPASLLSSSSLSLLCQMLQTVSDLCSPASASPSPPCTAEPRTGQGISDTASPVLNREARTTSLSPLAMSGTLSVLSAQHFLVLHVFGNAFRKNFLVCFWSDHYSLQSLSVTRSFPNMWGKKKETFLYCSGYWKNQRITPMKNW